VNHVILQSKSQQIHYPEFFSVLGAKIIDILDAGPPLPSVIPAKAGIQLRCRTDIHNTNFRFLKFSEIFLADFQLNILSPFTLFSTDLNNDSRPFYIIGNDDFNAI